MTDQQHHGRQIFGLSYDRQAFIGGILLIVILYALGTYISVKLSTANIMETNAFTGVVLFISLSMGHYMGKALTKEGSILNSFLIGVFSALFVGALLAVVFNPASWYLIIVMLFSAPCLILCHTSGLIKEDERIEKLITVFAEWLPGAVLPIIGAFFYAIPFIINLFR